MMGTFINMITVLIGSCLGILLGERLPERIRETVMGGLGLLVLVIGIQMALKTNNILILMGSILIGGVLGEWINIQQKLDRLGQSLQSRFGKNKSNRFSEGFVTASLVFCVGPMTFLGALQDGLTGNYELLAIKAMLDGFASLAFAAVFGIGVLFSIGTIFILQGSISLGATLIDGLLTPPMIDEMTAAGGLMIIGIGFALLDLLHLRIANYLPALAIAPLLYALSTHLHF
jgi:uncharacterized membrane protein YqgA involved in biofilm formation